METPFVTCRLFGQMGNQLFQIATTLAYAWDHQVRPLFPALHQSEDRISYNRDRIFFRLDAGPLPRPPSALFQEPRDFSTARPPFHPDLLLSGYFQSWRHFDHHREKLRPLFAPSEAALQKLQNKYAQLLALNNTVSIHVRTKTKGGHESKLHPFIGFQYYREAMAQFSPDTTFVVFSDRANWTKHHFSTLFQNRFVFIEGNDGVDDFFLMSMMKDHIICNSTYSWWAAYLNPNPKKRILTPEYWMDPIRYPHFIPAHYFPLGWTYVPIRFDHPYPEDMDDYQDIYQSVNG